MIDVGRLFLVLAFGLGLVLELEIGTCIVAAPPHTFGTVLVWGAFATLEPVSVLQPF